MERIAKNRREYSKAARRLLSLMFTEVEREGRCLIDHRRRSETTGEIVIKKGLEDQDKLEALQGNDKMGPRREQPVFGVSDKVSFKSVYSATETS